MVRLLLLNHFLSGRAPCHDTIQQHKEDHMGKLKHSEKEITITGFVDELDFDQNDLVGVQISTQDDEYLVEYNSMGKKLLYLIGEEVAATGVASQDGDGNRRIRISDFRVLQYGDDPADHDHNSDDSDPDDRW
jgi:hypothetical protein